MLHWCRSASHKRRAKCTVVSVSMAGNAVDSFRWGPILALPRDFPPCRVEIYTVPRRVHTFVCLPKWFATGADSGGSIAGIKQARKRGRREQRKNGPKKNEAHAHNVRCVTKTFHSAERSIDSDSLGWWLVSLFALQTLTKARVDAHLK